MRIADIITAIESWAPKWTAWEKDNVGLQIGDPSRTVKRILVTLDVTDSVVQEAINKKIDLIVSHHPLLFRPPATISTLNPLGHIILRLAEHHIAVYASHTNLDSVKGGVSFSLAQRLGLMNVRFLQPLQNTLSKIIVFVPQEFADRVQSAMADAGAGKIGEYHECSFSVQGIGSFRSSLHAQPFRGSAGKKELVDEVRLEMIAPRATIESVIRAMKNVHPYEEAAYDIVPLLNDNPNFGMGALGDLPHPVSAKQYLDRLKRVLHAGALRYSGSTTKKIQRIAVCGGAGSDLLPDALRAGADMLVTADVRYHTFQSAPDTILLVDAGHYETEITVLQPLADYLDAAAHTAGTSLSVSITTTATNPVKIV